MWVYPIGELRMEKETWKNHQKVSEKHDKKNPDRSFLPKRKTCDGHVWQLVPNFISFVRFFQLKEQFLGVLFSTYWLFVCPIKIDKNCYTLKTRYQKTISPIQKTQQPIEMCRKTPDVLQHIFFLGKNTK